MFELDKNVNMGKTVHMLMESKISDQKLQILPHIERKNVYNFSRRDIALMVVDVNFNIN